MNDLLILAGYEIPGVLELGWMVIKTFGGWVGGCLALLFLIKVTRKPDA